MCGFFFLFFGGEGGVLNLSTVLQWWFWGEDLTHHGKRWAGGQEEREGSSQPAYASLRREKESAGLQQLAYH